MTKITFYKGLRVIGGTFVMVETEKAKCMFDFGFCQGDLSDDQIRMRQESYIEDYIELGIIPAVDGIYEEKVAKKFGLNYYGQDEKECFFFISHMHIDHMGGLGMLDSKVPVYMSKDSERLYRKLVENGDIEYGAHDHCIGLEDHEEIRIGDISLRLQILDHDVIGASGCVITTPDGSICYTGDYRFHGFHPEWTEKFAQDAHGVDVLITEGVTVSSSDVDMVHREKVEDDGRTEEILQTEMAQYARHEEGLLVVNPYNRNVERLHNLMKTLAKEGRILVLDPIQADYVQSFYPQESYYVYEKLTKDQEKKKDIKYVTLKELLDQPSRYALQLDYKDTFELLDLKEVISLYVHMDGAPLGPYDPSYEKLKAFLKNKGVPYIYKSLGGHARPYYLRHMVETISPKLLIPLHSMRPEQVQSAKVTNRLLPEPGQVVTLPLEE